MSSSPTPEKPADSGDATRQERRAEKLRRRRARMKQHGRGLAQVYRDVVAKRGRKGDKE